MFLYCKNLKLEKQKEDKERFCLLHFIPIYPDHIWWLQWASVGQMIHPEVQHCMEPQCYSTTDALPMMCKLAMMWYVGSTEGLFSVPMILLWYATFHHIAISNKSRPQKDKISFVEGKLFSAGWALPRLQLLVSYCTAHLPLPTAAKVERSSNQSETISLLIHHVSRHTLTLRTKGASKTIVATFTRFANLVRCRQAWRYCMQWRTLKLVLGN